MKPLPEPKPLQEIRKALSPIEKIVIFYIPIAALLLLIMVILSNG